jgi:hypothetical protein
MKVFGKWAKTFFPVPRRYAEDDWPSVVLLLRNPEFPGPEQMLQIAQKSWGAGGPVKLLGTLREKQSYTFACNTTQGSLWFSVHVSKLRYGSEGRETLEVLQRPWDEHSAWMSIDSPHQKCTQLSKDKSLADIYKVLLIFAFQVWSPNALAVFFPAERTTIPNLGELANSIQWARRASMDMSFLD